MSDLTLSNSTTDSCDFKVELSNPFNKNYYKELRITGSYYGRSTDDVDEYVERRFPSRSSSKCVIRGEVDNGMSAGHRYTLYAYAQAKNGTWYKAGSDSITMEDRGGSSEFDLGIKDIYYRYEDIGGSYTKADDGTVLDSDRQIRFKVIVRNYMDTPSPEYQVSLYNEDGERLYRDPEPSIREQENAYVYATIKSEGRQKLKFAIELRESGWKEDDSRDNIKYRTYTFKYPEPDSGERYVTLDNLKSDLIKLHNLAKDYMGGLTQQEINEKICDFMRINQYDNIRWHLTIRDIDNAFVNYVKNNDRSIYNTYANKYLYMTDRNNEIIEVKHLFATLQGCFSVYSKTPDSWYGWAGDLATLSVNVHKACGSEASLTTLKAKAKELMGSSKASFPRVDLISDIDGALMANQITKNRNLKIYNVFSDYYSATNRKNEFITSVSRDIDKQKFIANVRYETAAGSAKGEPLRIAINKTFGPYNATDMEASTIAFADYVFNNL